MTLKEFYNSSLEYERKGNIATLLKDILILLETDKGMFRLTVKKGFKWNGNSGAFPYRFSKDNERYNVSILIHDVLYHDSNTTHLYITKADADDILRGCLRESGYCRLMAGIIHKAVTLFGNHSFGNVEFKDNVSLISFKGC